MPDELHVPIESESDIVTARQHGRELASLRGFSRADQAPIATAISEVARNIVEYARRGEIVLRSLEHDESSPGKGTMVTMKKWVR